MKQTYNKKQTIGTAIIRYDQTGKPTEANFVPAEFSLDAAALAEQLAFPAESSTEVVTKAQVVMSAYFLKMANIEEADREFSRIESEMVKCEKWDSGLPKYCEVKFHFVTTEPTDKKEAA